MRTVSYIHVLSLVLVSACVDFLEPGEFGTPRYIDNMRGAVPLRLVPPISDREGNTYVLFGAKDITTTEARVGKRDGGWKKGCKGHRGDGYGLHGWVDRGQDRAWYWSGEALVVITSDGGGCRVLTKDPETRASFRYLAVVPRVRETPSRTTTVAMVNAEGDPRVHILVIDLIRDTYLSSSVFEPAGATDFKVLGVGASSDPRVGFAIVRYEHKEEVIVEALYISDEGEILRRAPIAGLEDVEPYSVRGYLQSANGKRVVGLLEDGRILNFGPDGGGASTPDVAMTPVGVHRWRGDVFLVGAINRRPVLAPIGEEDGKIGSTEPWRASIIASDALFERRVRILDDRSDRLSEAVWTSPRSAIGDFPFLSPFVPEQYALGTTSWLIAGPKYSVSGDVMTSVAFLPMGISYP